MAAAALNGSAQAAARSVSSERKIVVLLIERLREIAESGGPFLALAGGCATGRGRGGGSTPLATLAATRQHDQVAHLDLSDVLRRPVLLVLVRPVLDAA